MEHLDFAAIGRRLCIILDELNDDLSPSERREVVDFIDVGEYGIALETLSALLVEERKVVSGIVYSQMVELAEMMGIRASTITEELETCTKSDDSK